MLEKLDSDQKDQITGSICRCVSHLSAIPNCKQLQMDEVLETNQLQMLVLFFVKARFRLAVISTYPAFSLSEI